MKRQTKLNEDIPIFDLKGLFSILSEPIQGVYATTVAAVRQWAFYGASLFKTRKERKLARQEFNKTKKIINQLKEKEKKISGTSIFGVKISSSLSPEQLEIEKQEYEELLKETEKQLSFLENDSEYRGALEGISRHSERMRAEHQESSQKIAKIFSEAYKEMGDVDIRTGEIIPTETGTIQFLTNPAGYVVMQLAKNLSGSGSKRSSSYRAIRGIKDTSEKAKQEHKSALRYQLELATIFFGKQQADILYSTLSGGMAQEDPLKAPVRESKEKEKESIEISEELNSIISLSGLREDIMQGLVSRVSDTARMAQNIKTKLKKELKGFYEIYNLKDDNEALINLVMQKSEKDLISIKENLEKEFNSNNEIKEKFKDLSEEDLQEEKKKFVDSALRVQIEGLAKELVVEATETIKICEELALSSIIATGLPFPGSTEWDSNLPIIKKWREFLEGFLSEMETLR